MIAEAVASPPAPGADQRNRRYALGVDRDRIGHAHDLGDGGILRHHRRMHALFDAFRGFDRNAQELDAVAELGGGIEIGRA